jgi:membrane-bound metal-dependent hydrolase YbcI (DUF457 family)
MSPATHFLTGWVLATAVGLNRRERAAVTVAAVIPDVDGLGMIPELLTRHSQHPLLWFSLYHHALHSLLFALVVSVGIFFLSNRRFAPAALALLAFHLHLLEDLVGSRGPDGFDWPIPYLFPFSHRWDWSWAGQWELNGWPNLVLTAGLLCMTLWMANRRGYSPVDLISPKADSRVVAAIRKRFRAALAA